MLCTSKNTKPEWSDSPSIVDTYYDKAKKCSRQKTVESIGWLDELEKKYDDPIAHFQKRVEQLKAEKAARQAPIHFTFTILIAFV